MTWYLRLWWLKGVIATCTTKRKQMCSRGAVHWPLDTGHCALETPVLCTLCSGQRNVATQVGGTPHSSLLHFSSLHSTHYSSLRPNPPSLLAIHHASRHHLFAFLILPTSDCTELYRSQSEKPAIGASHTSCVCKCQLP